jgi:hypothetical protein
VSVLYIIAYADRANRALNISLSLWPSCGPAANRTGASGPCMGSGGYIIGRKKEKRQRLGLRDLFVW